LRYRNDRAATQVGLHDLSAAAWQAHFAHFAPLPDNLEQPLALRYHGHQFDVYNPALGDGRGFLFAQLRDRHGRLLDLGTKGSGTTPYSRGGDGRLTLKGGVREVLATEMLEALGVRTSRTFALFETGEALERGDEPSPTRSSVLTRLSHSHVRFGTFQRMAFERSEPRLQRLLDYCCSHLLPELDSVPSAERVPAFLAEVTQRSAELCASWMVAGFVHGVLNSDNMVVTGESFDYGPYRFLPHYDPDFTAAYFDHGGLYRYARQPRAVANNLLRLAGSLTLLAPEHHCRAGIDGFTHAFTRARTELLLTRLGLAPLEPDADDLFADAVWTFLAQSSVSVEQFFFDWLCGTKSSVRTQHSPQRDAYRHAAFEAVAQGLEAHSPVRPGRLAHRIFTRPSPPSLVIDEIERVWSDIAERDDWSAFEDKVAEIRELGDALSLGNHPA
jgi:uncharacterized protein YdiU (UPF0061 family)